MASVDKLGKYEIRRELGKGAMGVVYEGYDPMIQRIVALKTILPQYLNGVETDDALARFKREAQAAGRLNHPGIVAVYEYGEEAAVDARGAPNGARIAFIAMEYVQGRELRDFFNSNQRFALPEVARIMREVLDALGHAHAHGVVHRDMKPANLFVLDNGKIKIADFGIARIEASELTQVGTVMGTPAYMSPEQIMGQAVDGRSDIFSCGVILYQLLTGEKPFSGGETAVMYKVLNEVPLAPSMLNVGLPAAFDAVVKKAMAKAPEQRFQSAQEFSQAIEAALADIGADDATVLRAPAPVPPGAAGAPLNAPAQSAQAAPVRADPTGTRSAPPAPPVPPGSSGPSAAANPAGRPDAASGARTTTLIGAGLAVLLLGVAGYLTLARHPADTGLTASATAVTAQAVAPGAPPAPPAAAALPVQEPGNIVVSALGLVDPNDPKFHGDAQAAQAEARIDAKRQLVEKALALYVDAKSLDQNYALIEHKLLANYDNYIKNVIYEGAPATGKDGLVSAEARAVLNGRALRKSLNELSKDERVDFIRNNGDPKVSLQMTIANADNPQAPARSQLAENVLKERIKSFGFRVWANDADSTAAAGAKHADFHISGEVKLKTLSAKLPASGLTITKTVLSSWTVKAVDQASNEEIYLNTVLPKGQTWASEEQALSDIGKLIGDQFSRDFFLQHFEFGVQKTSLHVQGVPDAQTARLLLDELRAIRTVLDVEMGSETGSYQIELAQGSGGAMLQRQFIEPLNRKLGQACLALGAVSENVISISFAAGCAAPPVRAKLETQAPAGIENAPGERGKQLQRPGALRVAA